MEDSKTTTNVDIKTKMNAHETNILVQTIKKFIQMIQDNQAIPLKTISQLFNKKMIDMIKEFDKSEFARIEEQSPSSRGLRNEVTQSDAKEEEIVTIVLSQMDEERQIVVRSIVGIMMMFVNDQLSVVPAKSVLEIFGGMVDSLIEDFCWVVKK